MSSDWDSSKLWACHQVRFICISSCLVVWGCYEFFFCKISRSISFTHRAMRSASDAVQLTGLKRWDENARLTSCSVFGA